MIFGLPANKRPKNVQEGLGLENTGSITAPPKLPDMTAGGVMGSLTEMAMERKKSAGELGGPTQGNQQAMFNNKKKKRISHGVSDAASSFGQPTEA
jgi:hypothetical protein